MANITVHIEPNFVAQGNKIQRGDPPVRAEPALLGAESEDDQRGYDTGASRQRQNEPYCGPHALIVLIFHPPTPEALSNMFQKASLFHDSRGLTIRALEVLRENLPHSPERSIRVQ